MKKLYIILHLAVFGLGNCFAQDTPVTIYTPKNSSVSAYNMAQESNGDRQDLDDYFALTYPNATQIKTGSPALSSSRKYNCHGYAWHIAEGGAELWIGYSNTTSEDIYMSDGSYVEVCSATYPGKVSWGSGDHSAVTTSTSGVYKSKWNKYPFMQHAWNDTPYGTSNLKYYVSTKISGSTSILCSGTRNFSVQNISGATYTWSVNSSVLSIVSGQGTNQLTVQRNGSNSGDGWIEVQISTSCSSSAATSKRESFYVGVAKVNSITVNTSMCLGYSQMVVANMSGSPSSSAWSITSGNASNAYLSNYGSGSASFNTYIADCYGLTINMTNTCGSSSDGTSICADNCFARSTVYPNPAKESFTLDFGTQNLEAVPDLIDIYSDKSMTAVKSISVQDYLKSSQSTEKSKIVINVNDLPRGIYYLHLVPNKSSAKSVVKIRIQLE